MRHSVHPRGALGLALALATLAAPPPTAWGAGVPQFRFSATNGYDIVVGGRGPTAVLSVVRSSRTPHLSGASSTYVARGRVSTTAIRAKFGSLGAVAVRFHSSGKTVRSKPTRGCKGANRTVTRYGVFVGDVRFRGEGGYTSAHIHRAKGKVVSHPSLGCTISTVFAHPPRNRGGGAKQKSATLASLEAGFKSGVSATYFEAITTRDRKTHFAAATARTEGALALYRVVFVKASPLTFAFDNALSFASVTPPAPFSGTGSLQRDADGSKTWTGSLTVSFPGEPDVPLVGTTFTAQLARGF